MKCYYIVIAYLPGYSRGRRFLNALRKDLEHVAEYSDTRKLLEIVVDLTPSSDFEMTELDGKDLFLQIVICFGWHQRRHVLDRAI
jgi:hypothetical protein